MKTHIITSPGPCPVYLRNRPTISEVSWSEQALALNPAYTGAHTFYAFYLSSLGQSEEALAVAKRALDRDPASPLSAIDWRCSFTLQGNLTRRLSRLITRWGWMRILPFRTRCWERRISRKECTEKVYSRWNSSPR